jgi:DNA-binding NtrC family response regulator
MNIPADILVVDDDPDIRHTIAAILKKRGLMVVVAADGPAALEYLQNHKTRLVLCDIEMPKMNGLDILEIIKARFPDLPVIIMTGYGDIYSVREALFRGADEYITKPFTAQELTTVLECLPWRKDEEAV